MKVLYLLLVLSICTYPIPSIRIGGQPIALFLSIYALAYFSIKGYARKVDWKSLWPSVVLLLGFLISSLASDTFNSGFIINLTAFYVIFFVLANIENDAVYIENNVYIGTDSMIKVLIFSGFLLGCYGYYGYITGQVGTDSQYFWWDSMRYWGIHYTESTRNADVHYIVFPFIALLVKGRKRIRDILLLLFFGLAMILSMARNTWLCMFVVLLVYLFLQDNLNKKIKYIGVGILAAATGYLTLNYFGMTDYFVGKLLSIFSMDGTNTISNSNGERWEVVLTTLKVISEHIFGVGAEEMHVYYGRVGLKLNHAENTYLNIWAEMGLVSLISYAYIVWTPVVSMVHFKKKSVLTEREEFVLLSALYFGLTILFNTETINCFMWIILGIIWFERRTAINERIKLYAHNQI